jgi:hypothetical protein
MNSLVVTVRRALGKSESLFHWPYWMGFAGGICFDLLAKVLCKKLPVSSIRVKKFCANTMFASVKVPTTAFKPPISLAEGLKRTIQYEFIDQITGQVFYTE